MYSSAAGLHPPYGTAGSDATRHNGKNEYNSEPVHTGFKLRQLTFDHSWNCCVFVWE